ncbi:MAG: hypothetical protein GXO02_04775, partial [Epsilonproteobacteria bacterium]|nr:hypothetical protein [Campylobacterota bacterium]
MPSFAMVDELFNLSKNKNIFLTGKAGSGKSYTILKLIEKLKANRVNFLSLGSTGISAFNIGGYTIHSFFKFNIASSLEELQEVDKRASKDSLEELKKILSSLDLIIIDEIS